MPDGVSELIKTAATPDQQPELSPDAKAAPPEAVAPAAKGSPDAVVEALGKQLAGLIMANPEIADKIADVLENLGKEEPKGMMQQAAGTAPPMGGPVPEAPAVAPQGVAGPAIDPLTQARLEEIERQLADFEVDKELSRLSGRYSQLRPHFGDVLPESLEEKALLKKVHEIATGRASPFDLALSALLLEQITSGEGTLRDRLLAAAAKNVQKPPAVEGRGGGVATAEGSPDVGKMSTTQLMDYIKNALAARRGQPG